MSEKDLLVNCYNRGCGQKFEPSANSADACCHHPGAPFFHDAYKGWSCCNKKCTDFTEFLNIKGCTVSCHSNVKPPEPEKPQLDENLLASAEENVPERKPIATPLHRPPFNTPLVLMQPEITSSLKKELITASSEIQTATSISSNTGEIAIGTSCQNNGCNVSYEGPETNLQTCVYHPGCPIFHEGLKFWSCCQKRTSDFNAFLSQVGCESGTHLWIKDKQDTTNVKCRWDWHQTGTHVIVSIYAKQYCPTLSTVQLNAVRLAVTLVFPQQANATFNLDIELRGVIDVNQSNVTMLGSKVEIKLRKAEAGSWSKLDIPREKIAQSVPKVDPKVESLEPQMFAVDLSDL